MRWLSPRSRNPRTTSQPRSSAQRGSSELLSEESHISSDLENIGPPVPNDNGGILQAPIPRQHNPPPRWTNELAMGDATLPNPDDLIQAIHLEEKLGWRNSAITQPAAPRDHLDTVDHPGESLSDYWATWTKYNLNIRAGEATKTEIKDTKVLGLDIPGEGELMARAALREPATIASHHHVVEPHSDPDEGTILAETYHDAPDVPIHSALHSGRHDGAVNSEDPGDSASGDGPFYLKPRINSPAAPPKKKKPRQFPLAIPKPSFNFIPKTSADSPKQPTRSKSILPKVRGRTKSDDPTKPATTKKLRFSTEVHSSTPPRKRRLSLGRKKTDTIKKSSLAGIRSGEISPLTITEPESSFVLPAYVEPTDVPTEPRDAPGSAPKPKPHKPSSRSFFKPNKRHPLSHLSPTAVSPIPGQPYEHIPSPEEPNPNKKLRLGRLAKPKAILQHGIRQWRKFTLRKSVLQVMLGRQLAGPVAANLKVLAGKKTVLEGGPGTGLWKIADGRLGERSLPGRPVG